MGPLLPSFYMVQVAFVPMPPPWSTALAEIEVDTSIYGAGMFRLHFDLSKIATGDFDALVFDLFRPLVPIRISLSFGLGLPMTIINGFARDAQLKVGNEPGSARMEVTGADALGTTMGLVQQPMPWPNIPDSVIVAAIFGKYAIVPMVTPTPPTRTILGTTSLQQARDSAFVQQMAGFHSYEVFIQPDPLAGVDIGHFMPVSLMLNAPPQGVLSIDFGSQTNLTSFQVTNQMLRPTMVRSTFVDADTRVPATVFVPLAGEMPMGREPSLMRVLPAPIEIESSNEAANIAERVLRATAQVTDSARTVQASGEVDGLKFTRPLLPGLPVLIRGAGNQHSGLYLVTGVSHRISRDGYTQSFQAMRNAVGLTSPVGFVDLLAPIT